jgi:hypothetical protein
LVAPLTGSSPLRERVVALAVVDQSRERTLLFELEGGSRHAVIDYDMPDGEGQLVAGAVEDLCLYPTDPCERCP